MTSGKIPIAVAHGDGIGTEIMGAVLRVLDAAGAPLKIHQVDIGEKVYLAGHPTGIDPATWEILRGTRAFLKAPITTPQGGGFKSLNVTIRTTLGLFANVRPCVSYAPFVETKHPRMDLVILRENEEDLYAGIEYRQTPDVAASLKLISRPGTTKIVRYAFEYARNYGRKKVSCFTKDNIMKLSDGLFHAIFKEIAAEYPEIESEHWIVDIGAAKLADTPEQFDLIVLPNLYGDILSDVAAQISGSVGLAGSANIGAFGAMFEAIHGSAPRRAGQNLANPSGLLLGAVLMLLHLGENATAERIHNSWLRTIERGIHTYDIFREKTSREKVGTRAFADALIKNLGKMPTSLRPARYKSAHKKLSTLDIPRVKKESRLLVGVDVFLYWRGEAAAFSEKMRAIELSPLSLQMISNRGVWIWPGGHPETFCVDQWCCRFQHQKKGEAVTPHEVIQLLEQLTTTGHEIIKTENLYTFDGAPGYSSAEG